MEKPLNDTEALKAINDKLSLLIRLTGLNVFKDGVSADQIRKLREKGFNNQEIAAITGAKYNTITGTISRAKGRKGNAKQKAKS